MKKPQLLGRLLLAILLLAGLAPAAWAQSPVTVSPAYFTDNTPITLTFDATLGNAGLASYTGDVYIYTGVITNLSTSPSDWKHVVNPNGFGTPTAAEKLTPLGNHKYSISFTPRTFYPGLASSGETVQRLAMVFRGANGTPEGKGVGNSDIFVGLGLQVAFTSPASGTLVAAGSSVAVAATATAPATLTLTLNGTQVAQQTNATTLNTNVTVTQPGVNTLVISGNDGTTTASATTTVVVPPTVTTAELPAGAKPDGITYLANGTSVILSLTAPKKSYVYVLGEFNNWQTTT
ncbi:MAG: 1,4-alpha-glucan-branching protein, partial [Hymenobacter sp.]